jgi:hypothetical protein
MPSLFAYSSKSNILNFRISPELKDWIVKKNVSVELKKVLIALVESLWVEDEQTINQFLNELSKKQIWEFLIYFFLTHGHLNLEDEFSKLKHKIIELKLELENK